jgi:hypothetical protein
MLLLRVGGLFGADVTEPRGAATNDTTSMDTTAKESLNIL